MRVGLPRMHKEKGERRDFLPPLVDFLDRVGATEIVLEEGYGSGMDIPIDRYLAASSRARTGSWDDCLACDVVVVVRYPGDDVARRLKRGTVLVSMLHYPTRPDRVTLLRELGIRGVAMDQVTDDLGKRLVEDLVAVGWNGVRAAFRELARTHPRFEDPGRSAICALVIGSGAVGSHAIRACTRYGDPAVRERLAKAGVDGVEVTVVDYDLTSDEAYMRDRFGRTDLLIDATQRPDPTKVIVPNAWLASLPPHAVILDLAVDPYDFSHTPPHVKGIEGVPEGNLDRFVFPPDDPAWDALPAAVRRENRRVALSCYSWPGVEPRQCMEVYGGQIEPVLRCVVGKGIDKLDPQRGTYYDRAVARADIARWRPK